MEFSVQATLGYRVQLDTPFVFNVQGQAFTGQTIKSEPLRIGPDLPTEDWTMPESANRYFRLIAPAGQATVLLSHPTEDPAEVFEVPPGELPRSVLTHLYPSRYCQADPNFPQMGRLSIRQTNLIVGKGYYSCGLISIQ
jgi:hypothetical protein